MENVQPAEVQINQVTQPVVDKKNPTVEMLKDRFQRSKKTVATWAKGNPVKASVIAVMCLVSSGYMMLKDSSHSNSASLYGNTQPGNSKLNVTQNIQEGSFLVLSAAKKNDKLFINNAKDYKQASTTVVVDLKACPSLAVINPQALIGQNIKFKGNFATYDGKPQIIVSNANDLTLSK